MVAPRGQNLTEHPMTIPHAGLTRLITLIPGRLNYYGYHRKRRDFDVYCHWIGNL